MKTILTLLLLATYSLHAQREIQPLDSNWRFHLGDTPKASVSKFDDSSWKAVSVPHDWSFEAGVSEDGAQRDKGGYYSGGIGWYRTHFKLQALKSNTKTFLTLSK